jgi:quinol monooxygenase YgiN
MILDLPRRPDNQCPMLIVHVHAHVKPEFIEPFKQATVENARQSLREPGVAAFDILQQLDDPSRFVLVEIYRTPAAPAAHKETAHYQKWRDTVAPMMCEPRASTKFAAVVVKVIDILGNDTTKTVKARVK